MKKFLLFLLLISLPLLAACSNENLTSTNQVALDGSEQSPANQNSSQTPYVSPTPSLQMYTMVEVAQHATKEDCWLVLSEKVYDVTKMIDNHPGGDAILQGCGKDATELFETRPMGSETPHSGKARNFAKGFEIGILTQ